MFWWKNTFPKVILEAKHFFSTLNVWIKVHTKELNGKLLNQFMVRGGGSGGISRGEGGGSGGRVRVGEMGNTLVLLTRRSLDALQLVPYQIQPCSLIISFVIRSS
jgi:hypothetical protein